MKKIITFSMMSLAALVICMMLGCTDKETDYVDLGLSSGTLWKTHNEGGVDGDKYYYFDDAYERFEDSLPSMQQWMELVNECKWRWTGAGYKVVGPNGKSITLPALGFCLPWFDGEVAHVGESGLYWSSESVCSEFDSECTALVFSSNEISEHNYSGEMEAFTVRLVKNNK